MLPFFSCCTKVTGIGIGVVYLVGTTVGGSRWVSYQESAGGGKGVFGGGCRRLPDIGIQVRYVGKVRYLKTQKAVDVT